MSRACLNFAAALVLATIALAVISALLNAYADFDVGAGASIVPPMVAALFAGQRHVNRTGSLPTGGFSWRAAGWMTAVSTVISLVKLAVLLAVIGVAFEGTPVPDLQSIPAGIFATIFAALLLVQFLVIRFFFGMGAKQAAKAIDMKNRDVF